MPKANIIKPVLDGTTMHIYADGGPVEKAMAFWHKVRDRWFRPWYPHTALSLMSVAAWLGPQALGEYCTVMGVEKKEALAYLATLVDKDSIVHIDIREQYPDVQTAFLTLTTSRIRDLSDVPLVNPGTRVWRFRKARANHARSMNQKG